MKKKILAVALCVTMAMSFGACKKKDGSDFKLGKYKEVEVQKSIATITDEYLDQYIDYVLQQSATTKQVKKGKVKEGDSVNIDYEGILDGEKDPFQGGSATGQTLLIGSNTFIDGFEDGLIGKKVGETVKLKLQFPKEYKNDPDKAGKKVTFTVTINALEVTEVPELNDEFVKKNYGENDVSTVEEFKVFAKERLELSQIINAIWTDTVNGSEMTISDKDLESKMDSLRSNDEAQAESMSVNVEQYAQYYYGIKEGEYEDYLKKQAEFSFKEPHFVKEVAEKENIKVEDSEYNEQMEYYSSYYSRSQDEIESMYKEYYNMSFREMILASKVREFVAKNIKIVEDETQSVSESASGDNKDTKAQEDKDKETSTTKADKKDDSKQDKESTEKK